MFYPKSPFLKNPGIESQIFKRNSPEVKKILEWLCISPKHTTYRINLLKTTREEAKSYITKIIEAKFRKPPSIFLLDEVPEVLCISSIDEIPVFNPELKEVIVDIYCGSALLRGAHVYGPGVLAMNTGTQLNEKVNVFADLAGKCKKGTNVFYDCKEKVFIGIGITKMQRYQLYGKNVDSSGIAVEMLQVISGVPSLGDLSSDKILLQNLPSIVCSKVLNPQPDEVILDMCAAPGNKTSHIVELTKNENVVIAIDKINSKIEALKKKIELNQWNNVYAFCFDSTKGIDLTKTDKSLETIRNGPPFAPEAFDRILLDAPCSSLGNRPLLSSTISQNMLKSYSKMQKKLFENAVRLLKIGGTLVYSTCTIHQDENEEIIVWAKKKFDELKLVPAEPIFGGVAIETDGLAEKERSYLQRFCINNVQTNISTIGFFIAKFIKVKSSF
ncbi:tRNA (cytosine(72)-C(5))-methyltransferase NSUN6 [Condylostylus longicornis]|uniref:tRNA (cytosine(72)-C(5))-methyltransferase NSUN6 n=1 Tax=Condylostylus longicornis TaxID=2530218 RepID=UPI00244E1A72|nr:tRNA (cytosine(72)-C(5))-methyltransferase NSUN6 [Condylostylus longicornis]